MQQSFALEEYYNAAFKEKLVGLLFCVAIILSVVYRICKIIIKLHKESPPRRIMESDHASAFIGHLISCLLIVLFVFAVIWPTFRYSMYLPFETEDEAMVEHGVITDIAPVPSSPKFYIGTDRKAYFASFVTISGTSYFFMTADGLTPGMEIEITYLPQSHMVLCYRTE